MESRHFRAADLSWGHEPSKGGRRDRASAEGQAQRIEGTTGVKVPTHASWQKSPSSVVLALEQPQIEDEARFVGRGGDGEILDRNPTTAREWLKNLYTAVATPPQVETRSEQDTPSKK